MRWLTRWLGDRSRTVRPARPQVPLRSEELEPRWNPATSTNWSGYAVTAATHSVTAVSGEWTVPTVTGSTNAVTYSSVWVGIDGYSSSSVEQTGIEADVVHGVAEYYAWYEMYPSAPVTISSLAIHPGDTISASVNYNTTTGKFTLSIKDLSDPTGSNSFSVNQSGSNFQRSSAEWIVEAPSSNSGVLPLANFGSVTFTDASATINNVTGPINNSPWASGTTAINMVSSNGTLEASTSALNSTGTGFTVVYGSASPPVSPPPASPPSPPVSPPPPAPVTPVTGTVTTTTTLTGVVDPYTWIPTVTLTVVVSPSVPVGSTVELLVGNTVLGSGRVQNVGGVDKVSFQVEFFEAGTFTFTAKYMGSGQYDPSTSNSLTVIVSPASGYQHHFWSPLTPELPPPPPPAPLNNTGSGRHWR